MNKVLLGRFFDKVDFIEGCWLWTGAKSSGYGTLTVNWWRPKTQYAHRLAYQWFVGPIPKGLTIDHLCRIRHCVNPDHLEAVSQRENFLRGVHRNARLFRAAVCLVGHALTESNTYFRRDKYGVRQCRDCNRIRDRQRRQRVRAGRQGAMA